MKTNAHATTRFLFIDRDGVINKRIVNGYVCSPVAFEFLPGVLKSFALFNTLFAKIIVVTNQQGIGKGLMTISDLQNIHKKMIRAIEKTGGRVDAVYFCTDLAGTNDSCRKPNPNMAYRAQADFPELDFEKSTMVGDSASDMLFGSNLGMETVFIGEPSTLKNVSPHAVFPDLWSFAQSLKNETEK